MKNHPCPKCNRMLRPAGEATLEVGERSVTYPVYSCDECLQTVQFCGEPFEQALTFAVDEAGKLFDPTEPDGELRF